MLLKTAHTSILIALLTFVLESSLASAQTAVVSYTDRGWYSTTGQHTPSNTLYTVGDVRGAGCVTCLNDFRNFFVFDLAGVTQSIASAKLALFVPSQPGPGYVSPDSGENYELHDVVTPIATLVAGAGGVAAHTDLGSGVFYGSRLMTAADNGSVVEINLNSSAVAALDAANGLIGIGGSFTTLDTVANNEYTFAFSFASNYVSELRLTLVPEPSTLLLLGISAISLLGYRQKER